MTIGTIYYKPITYHIFFETVRQNANCTVPGTLPAHTQVTVPEHHRAHFTSLWYAKAECVSLSFASISLDCAHESLHIH